MEQGESDKALEALQRGLSRQPNALSLLEAKAELLFHLGQTDEAIRIYEEMLTLDNCPLTEQTKCLYTLTRIAQKSSQPRKALEYLQREAAIVRRAFGKKHLEVARIYQDIAKLLDDTLLDYDSALKYYGRALAIARWNLQQVQQKVLVCRNAQVCETYEAQLQEISSMIVETNKNIGRVHYKAGDFAAALQASFGR
jgi:tetratricopeptide (TPR) repeat protein